MAAPFVTFTPTPGTLTDALRLACAAEGIEYRDVPADGRWHTADLADDPRGRGDGRIRLFPDGRGGQVHNWKRSEKATSFFRDQYRPLSATERRQREWEARRRAELAANEKERARVATARRLAALAEASTPARDDHPYLARKGIPAIGLREAPLEAVVQAIGYLPSAKGCPLAGRILIARVESSGEAMSVEFIDEAGIKTALAGGLKGGGYWTAQPLPEGDGEGLALLIAEGVATALSAMEATGHPVAAALSAGNLGRVAQTLRARYPRAALVVLADLGNGQTLAEQAARESGAALAVPAFAEDLAQAFQAQHGKPPTDFNDLAALAGPEAVAGQVRAALATRETVLEPQAPAPKPTPAKEERAAQIRRVVFDAVRDRGPFLDREALGTRLVQETGLSRAAALRTIDATIDSLRERRFRQPFGLKAAALAIGAEYRAVNSPYLPPLPTGEGVCLVRSPMGTGKTYALAALDGNLLYVSHLQSLVGNAAGRLGLEDYRDAGYAFDLAQPGKLAICVNSVWKVAGTPASATLVVDESNQLARRLAGLLPGETCKPALVHQELVRQAAGAERAFYLDAQADALSLFLAQKLHPGREITVVDNTWRPPAAEARRVAVAGSHTGLVGAFLAAVAGRASGTGERAMLCTDSEREAQGLAELIARLHPGLRVLAVTGKTAGNPEMKAVLADLDGRIGGYDVVLASPSLTTGVSVESTQFRVFGSYRHGHLATQDALQAISRVRRPIDTLVFVRKGGGGDGIDGAALADERRRRAAMAGADLPDDGGFRAEIFKAAHDHAVRSAMSRELFLWYAEDAGWQVEFVEGDAEAGRSALADARPLEEDRYRARVLAAPPLSADSYRALARCLERTEAEAFAIERHELEDFYRAPLDPALFGLDRRGRGRSAIALLEKLRAGPQALEILDRHQATAPGFCAERWRSSAAQAELLTIAFRALGLPDQADPREARLVDGTLWLGDQPAPEWNAATLDPAALADIQARRVEFKAHLGLTVPSDFAQAPLKFLNRVLAEKAGLKILGRRTHDRTRWYRLDPEAVAELGAAMRHRREALKADGSWPWAEPGLPAPVPGSRHHSQGTGAPPRRPPASLQARPESGRGSLSPVFPGKVCPSGPAKPLSARPIPIAREHGYPVS